MGLLGEGGAALSGESAACARCHGVSGEGTEEGGVAAPALLAERLFVPDARRGRPAHDDATLAAAIREGRVGSRRLGPAMPRFTLGMPEIEDLRAYLHCLGHEREPGVTEGAIRVGAAWPLSGPSAAQGKALAAVIADVFAEVEAQGGVFRRRIEVVIEDSSGPGGAIAAAERLARRDVFVVLASAPTTEPLRDDDGEEIPHIGPLGSAPRNAERVFQVRPGFDVLAQIAIGHAATAGRTSAFHVIAHDDASGRALRDGAAREASRRALPTPSERLILSDHFDATAAAAEVHARAPGGILFGGTAAELGAFVRALAADVDVAIYAPSAILGDDPAALDRRAADRTTFLHAGLVDDRVPAFVRDLRARLHRRGALAGSIGLAASAEVAARILIEGLRRAGSRPTRRGFVAALETLRDFEVGFSAPVSFGRGLRTGVMGAYLVRVDPAAREIVRVSDWLVASPLP
ncbi:ABC transporter substrate-binding protein [Polyangium sp. y55x31]|uniref:cytochrome c/ABC transporter substrate-binding protein n=1 Tax=Polyangium sp. y55x31 TaxID=3042688 RepID=UPI00248224AF|nr:ABC transporter substrate-binding protein [Polyangium sp. y55x31]MDI1479604.1 ABC transporter substrate-binding protein [Polyangium sp. y55x31]